MTIECDVLVVGGGPAGSAAARAAAKQGAKTILIEEHEEIGAPVQCAEGIGKYLIPFLPFKIPPEQLKWKIKGMTFWADDILIERNGGIWSGYTVNRKEWDQWLASLAKKEGADLRLNSKLVDLQCTGDYQVDSAVIESNGKKYEIHPKIVIAADGVHSTVVEQLNIRKKNKQDIGEVKSYELKNINLKYPNHDQLFLGNFAPGAYAYIFPISKSKANIGVGKIRDSKNNIDELYEKFLELSPVKNQIKNGEKTKEKGGYAPLKYSTDNWTYGNVILAGDSANQNFKPFIEGNLPGIICGDIAGNISVEGLKNKENLLKYKERVSKRLGAIFKSSDEILNALLKIYGIDHQGLLYLIVFSNICSLNTIQSLSNQNKNEIIEIISSWNNSRIQQLKTRCIEKFNLLMLSLIRFTGRA